MTLLLSQTSIATRRRSYMLRAGLLVVLALVSYRAGAGQDRTSYTNLPDPPTKPALDPAPITADERTELLKLIKSLQDRLDKLEAGQASKTGEPLVKSALEPGTSETRNATSSTATPSRRMNPPTVRKQQIKRNHRMMMGTNSTDATHQTLASG